MLNKLKYITVIINCLCVLSGIRALAQQTAITNPLGMEFALVQPGSFVAGQFSPPYPKPVNASLSAKTSGSQAGYKQNEFALAESLATQHAMPGFTVRISKAFYISKYEVTQAQWKKVMGYNPSIFQGEKVDDNADQHPVENVTWQDAQEFVKKLNRLHKGYVYRLPTEFEWEHAARAGAKDDVPWSEIRLSAQLGTRTTQQVGQKKSNAWGLHDMLGNVWEWVQDVYNEKIFAGPVPPKTGKQHVLKGASFVGDVKNATYLTHAAGPGNKWDVGFRLVMDVRKQK